MEIRFKGLTHKLLYGSSRGWEERNKLKEKAALKYINITLPIVPIAITIKLIEL